MKVGKVDGVCGDSLGTKTEDPTREKRVIDLKDPVRQVDELTSEPRVSDVSRRAHRVWDKSRLDEDEVIQY